MICRTTITRRDFLRASAVLGGTVLVGAPLGRSQRWLVQAQTSAPPTVDRLALRVVVDNAHDITVRSAKIGNVEVQRVGWGLGPSFGKEIHSEFGLGFHLESQRGSETRNYLLDYGASPVAELNNLDILKIDTASLDALILSHGHFDHFAGLIPLLKRDRAKMRRDMPLYLGGEDTFCYRWAELPNGQRLYAGVLDRRDLNAANVRLVQIEKPTVIEGHAFTTGAIPRVTFETPGPATKVEIGMREGAGCDASHFSKEEKEGKIVADRFRTEHATCFNVKDRGLVVISSCGHAGIVNSVKQAQAVSGEQKVHAVIGGFHLAPTPEPYQAQVVRALKEINPDWMIPMHCSGATFARMAQEAMPGKVIVSYTGTRYIFGA
jgi:7,8-dihydropterin-6-yl-methyl-4-(beta-D-ribofuranosyl)aminobenzene 5'-phosphate synthase